MYDSLNLTGADASDPFAPLSLADASPAEAELETTEVWEPILPAPNEPPEAGQIKHWKHGPAVARWVYRDRNGAPLFAVARFQTESGGKETLPYTWGHREWTVQSGPNKGERRNASRLAFQASEHAIAALRLGPSSSAPGYACASGRRRESR